MFINILAWSLQQMWVTLDNQRKQRCGRLDLSFLRVAGNPAAGEEKGMADRGTCLWSFLYGRLFLWQGPAPSHHGSSCRYNPSCSVLSLRPR